MRRFGPNLLCSSKSWAPVRRIERISVVFLLKKNTFSLDSDKRFLNGNV